MDPIPQLTEDMHKALFNSKKKDEDVIAVMVKTDRLQRIAIREMYDKIYPQRGLLEDIKKKLSGDFEDLVYNLFLTRPEYDADQMTRAFGTFGTEVEVVYELIFGRPLDLLTKMMDEFKKDNKKSLESYIDKKFGEPIKSFLYQALQTERSTNEHPNRERCKDMANDLLKVKPETWLSSRNVTSILLQSSPEELVLISRYYLKMGGKNIFDVIKNDLSSKISTLLNSLFYNVIAPSEYFANKINESIKGLGTDTNLLVRSILSRYDIDMPTIKQLYYELFKATVKEDVADDTSGSYQKLLIVLINTMSQDDI